MIDAMAELRKRLSLLLPLDVHEALVKRADRDGRSLHGQIVWVLRRYLADAA